MDLIDETSRVLDTVVGLSLPQRRWIAVGGALNRVDDAVAADDTKALRAALKRLRATAAGLVPSEPVIRRSSRRPGAVADDELDYASKVPIRWLAAILGAAVVLLGALIVIVMVVLSGGDDRGADAPPMKTSAAPSSTVAPDSPDSPKPQPPPSAGGVGAPLIIVVLAVGGVAFFSYRIWRRRTGSTLFGREAARRAADAPAEPRVPAPTEIIDSANRTAASLPGRGG